MQVKLKSQLFIGIALAIFLVLLLGTLSYITSSKEREAEDMINHTFLVKAKLQDINISLKDKAASVRARRRYANADSIYSMDESNSVLTEMEALQALIKDNTAQTERSTELFREIRGLSALWLQINPEETRNNAAKEEAYFVAEVNYLKRINAIVADMDRVESDLLKERGEKTLSMLEINNLANIGGTLLILAVVVALSVAIAREFRKRRVAEIKQNDQFEELERINQKTALHNEVLFGAQSVLEACQKTTTAPLFLQTMLDGILQFTGITSGIVYLTGQEDEQQLIPVYHRGVPADTVRLASRNALLTPEPDAKQSIVVIEPVPEDFWHISAATGSNTPGAIIYLYIRLQERLLGVIEIGSFFPLTERQHEFLKMISGAIAVRLSALQLAENRKSLVSELKENQEILLNQQEELRQANDELLQQTQVLQASEEELRVQEEELKQINAELEEKNDALESAREVMSMKAAELEQSGKYKSEFLANMSHELRTPLNSVLILANLLRDNKDKNLTAKQVEYAKIISNSGSDLLNLINDILDLSKIEAGKIELNIEQMPVDAISNSMHQMFFALAEEKKIAFSIHKELDVTATITTDRQRMEQILKNLLSNAFKFTGEQGSISLSIRNDVAGNVVFDVTDTGIGIDPAKQEMIFEAFKQADGNTNRKYGGTGLGLSISRELARILGGTIQVKSKPGEGSTFALHVPVQVSGPALPAAPTEQPLRMPATSSLPDDGREKTILIVEDDTNFASILRDFAEERSYHTIMAANGKEGLDMARQHKPDAIILDLQMPVMDGWEVLKHLKNDAALSKIPVHVISAMDEVKAPQGSVAYVKKPVTKEGLEKTFRQIGSYLNADTKKILILSAHAATDDTLVKFIAGLPSTVEYHMAPDMDTLMKMGALHDYDCIVADIGASLEDGIRDLQAIRGHQLFAGVSIILLIDRAISASDEMKLRGISEAIVMKSVEAHRRLKDELELFMFRVKEQPREAMLKGESFTDKNILSGKKVLVADDDMRNVFALVGLLESQQMEVITASNGREAVDLLDKNKAVDVVLMDIMMPEMDGYEAIRYLRGKTAFADLPIIALTAKAMAEDRELCIRAGASDYMSKPIDTQKLLSLLRIWLS